MKNHETFIAEESAARLQSTVDELDQLIQVEKNKDRLAELLQLKDQITSVLKQLNNDLVGK